MKNLNKVIAALLAIVMVLSLAGCGGEAPKPTETTAPATEATTEATTEPVTEATEAAYDAAAVIAGFTTTPEKVNATFTQTYVLDVQNDDYQSFAKDEADTVTVSMDLTAGDVYYYGKLVEKDGTVTEQLVRAEDGTYYAMTTTEAKAALADEAAAVAAIGDMMKALSLKTAGYVDPGFFTYTGDAWMTSYILLGSTNVDPQDMWFSYNYSDNEGGVKAEINADYIGYFGDSGTFEFGKQKEAEHAAVISLTTDANGYVTSFEEALTSYQELAIITPAVPLVLNGQRSLTATYGEAVERVESIEQTVAEPVAEEAPAEEAAPAAEGENGTIVLGEVTDCTVVTYDFDYATFAFVEGTEVVPGHFVAFQVEAAEGAEVVASVNGEEVSFINGYYCYMTPAEAGGVYTVAASVGAAAEAAAEENGTIVLGEVTDCTVVTYDFDYATFAFVEGTEVAPGHFVAFQVEAAEGAEVVATVNGEEVSFINGYYCYMTPAVSGGEYTVAVSAGAAEAPVEEVTEAPAEEAPAAPAAAIPVKVFNNSNAQIEVFDFVQGDYATLSVPAEEVTVGNFLAVKVTPAEGYELAHVRVNSKSVGEEMCFNGYWCVPATEDVSSFKVKVIMTKAGEAAPAEEEVPVAEETAPEAAPAAATVPVKVVNNKNAVIEVFDFVQGDYSTLTDTVEEVTIGNFLAIKVTPAEGYELAHVRVNSKSVSEEMCFNGYWCVPATEGVNTYRVQALLK